MHQQEYLRLAANAENGIYHYDTPLTVPHEIQTLLDAGFSHVDILQNWGATYTLKATK